VAWDVRREPLSVGAQGYVWLRHRLAARKMRDGKGARLGRGEPTTQDNGWVAGQLLVNRMLHDVGNLAVGIADEEPPDAPWLDG
jgi:hypothetical protein